MSNLPTITDERLWELWRQADNMHSIEVDLAFGRLVAEEAVRLEREPYRQLIELYQHSDMTDDEFVIRAIDLFGESIRARSQEGDER